MACPLKQGRECDLPTEKRREVFNLRPWHVAATVRVDLEEEGEALVSRRSRLSPGK